MKTSALTGKPLSSQVGGTGLGREMSLAMARAGADLVIASRRAGPIEEVAALVTGLGRRALAIPTDVTESAQVARLFERTLAEFGKVDVLINNAGLVGGGGEPIWEITDETWRNGIDGNLTSAFYCARAISKHMVDRGQGKIVNMASGYGLRGGKDTYIYSSAKGAVINFTRGPCNQPRALRSDQQLYCAGLRSHQRNGRVEYEPAAVPLHPYWPSGEADRAWPDSRIPCVQGLRLHER